MASNCACGRPRPQPASRSESPSPLAADCCADGGATAGAPTPAQNAPLATPGGAGGGASASGGRAPPSAFASLSGGAGLSSGGGAFAAAPGAASGSQRKAPVPGKEYLACREPVPLPEGDAALPLPFRGRGPSLGITAPTYTASVVGQLLRDILFFNVVHTGHPPFVGRTSPLRNLIAAFARGIATHAFDSDWPPLPAEEHFLQP